MELKRFAFFEGKKNEDKKEKKEETSPNEKQFKTILKTVFNAGGKEDADFNEYWEKSGESLVKKLDNVGGSKEEGGKDEKESKGGKNPHKFGTKEFWDFQKSMKKNK